MNPSLSALIVEDNPANLRLAADVLESAGWTVYRAGSADEALVQLSNNQPSVILMDLAMPGMDGLTLTRKIREERRATGIPIVALTASAMRGDQARAASAGCDGYIVKPINTRAFPEEVFAFARKNPAVAGLASRRLLVVEDRAVDRKLLRDIFTAEGWEVLEAEDGVEALEILDRTPVRVVVSDILMPRMDGYRLCYEMRRREHLKEVPYVVCTSSYTSPSDERLAMELGATRYVRKPLSPREFVALIEEVAEKRHHQAASGAVPHELEFMKEYSQRLVSKLVEYNEELEKKAAEAQRAQGHLDALLNSLEGVVWELDPVTLRFTYVSAYAEQLLGYPLTQWTEEGHFWIEHVHPAGQASVRSCVAGIIASEDGFGDFEHSMVAADGRVVWLRAVVTVLRTNGKPYCLRGIFVDVTERRRSDRRRALQYNVSEALAESATFDGAARKVLQIICESFGWPLGELWAHAFQGNVLRRTDAWHVLGHPEYDVFIAQSNRAVFSRSQGLPGVAWEMGKPIWCEDISEDPRFRRKAEAAAANLNACTVIPVMLRKEPVGVLCFFARSMEKLDSASMELLENLAAQMALFLERRRLEENLRQAQKMEAVGQLAGGIAHDFNNLLTVIEGHAAILWERATQAGGGTESIAAIRSAVERAATLTGQLLTFSRKQPMRQEVVDLNQLVSNLNKMFHRIIRENLSLKVVAGTNLPSIVADPGMIEQVLMNLVVNARDAMPEGGTIEIRTEPVTIDSEHAASVQGARPGQFVRLTVADSGTGIPPELLPRLFEPFFTTKPEGKGTGLGLATVHGIADQHGGWVEVDSGVGIGSSFHVLFPAHVQPSPKSKETEAQSPTPRGTETVLLVEDETSLRALMATILSTLGYTVLEASSGSAALELWDKHRARIDLILSDVIMPGGLSGRALVERIREEKPDLKAILSSGYESETMDLRWAAANSVHFLQKPFKPVDLACMVRKVLDE